MLQGDTANGWTRYGPIWQKQMPYTKFIFPTAPVVCRQALLALKQIFWRQRTTLLGHHCIGEEAAPLRGGAPARCTRRGRLCLYLISASSNSFRSVCVHLKAVLNRQSRYQRSGVPCKQAFLGQALHPLTGSVPPVQSC